MRVLVTRPRPDAERFAELLADRGHEVRIEPLFEIVNLEEASAQIDLSGIQALLFTSANGVRAFCAAFAPRRPQDLDLRVFAVGDASARTAEECGFGSIESADGDVVDLTALVTRRLDPTQGGLFHAAGSKVAGDLKGGLEDAGFRSRRAVLYETRALQALSAETQGQIRSGEIDAVTFFSPRTAKSFVRLIAAAGLGDYLEATIAVCLSAAVREELEALRWNAVLVAARPTQADVLTLLDPGGKR